MKGESNAMAPAAAIEVIRAIPPDVRSQFAMRIWRIRRQHVEELKIQAEEVRAQGDVLR
jgi:hypothetical protein